MLLPHAGKHIALQLGVIVKGLLVSRPCAGFHRLFLQPGHFTVRGGFPAVVQGAKPSLRHQLCAVGRFNSHVFMLILIDLLVGISDGRVCAFFYRAQRFGAFYVFLLGNHLFFKF